LKRYELIAGADVSYNRFSNVFYAGVIVLRLEDMKVIETRQAVRKVTFPYVPGLLSFREAPILLEAFAQLRCRPDAIVIDGQGLAHPRRIGFASHVGLWLDRPCIGCAKTLLTGQYGDLKAEAGSTSPLVDRGETVGKAVRTKTGVKPVFVTVGHRVDLASAVKLVLRTCRGYRIPEPTRQAHLFVNDLRRRAQG
jgi:deoxyribonuclease V